MPNGRPFTSEYSAYTRAGGPLPYESWVKAGRPRPRGAPAPPQPPPPPEREGMKWPEVSPEALPWLRGAAALFPPMKAFEPLWEGRWPWEQRAEAAPLAEFGPGYYKALERMAPEVRERFPEEAAPTPTIPEEAAARREAEAAAEEALGGIGEPLGPPEFPTTTPPEGYRWEYDSASMRYVLKPLPGAVPPAKMSDWQREQIRMAEEEAAREQREGEERQVWERQQWQAQQRQQAWQRQQAEQEAQREQAWRQQQLAAQQQQQEQMLGWYREQAGMQQAEQERVERARLAAQPQSWLQYAAYTGEQPAIQPWMQPLMPQQYQQLGAGQAIPGWTPEGGGAMPQLTRPSRQLQARMGPTAMQQYMGYRQARAGVRPEEEQWRLWAQAPPAGRGGGLRWTR